MKLLMAVFLSLYACSKSGGTSAKGSSASTATACSQSVAATGTACDATASAGGDEAGAGTASIMTEVATGTVSTLSTQPFSDVVTADASGALGGTSVSGADTPEAPLSDDDDDAVTVDTTASNDIGSSTGTVTDTVTEAAAATPETLTIYRYLRSSDWLDLVYWPDADGMDGYELQGPVFKTYAAQNDAQSCSVALWSCRTEDYRSFLSEGACPPSPVQPLGLLGYRCDTNVDGSMQQLVQCWSRYGYGFFTGPVDVGGTFLETSVYDSIYASWDLQCDGYLGWAMP